MSSDEEISLKPFLAHLEDLRQVLIRCFLALMVGMAIALPLTSRILDLLKRPLVRLVEQPDRFLRSIEVAGAFAIMLRIAFWSGLLLAAPFLAIFIGQFVFPGLHIRERRVIMKALAASVILFIVGAGLGYGITLPVGLQVMMKLHTWLGISAEWTVSSYVAFAIQVLIGFGLAFELPVVIMVLGRLGIISSQQLVEKRRHMIVILLILAMILTPPDIVTQLIMALPLILLYEVCIWLVRASERSGRTPDKPA